MTPGIGGLMLGDALSWPEVRDRLALGVIPLLPFGAHEQHGPHLPLATDTIMAAGLARLIGDALDGSARSLVLPAVSYGQTTDNDEFPGTLTLSFDTVRAITRDLATSLARSGARALVVINGDFGNQAPLRIAAREFAALPILVVNYPGLAQACAEVCTSEPAGFGLRHADEFETSIMLELAPETVDMTKAAAEYPSYPATFPDRQIGLNQLSRSGVFGDPSVASAQKGRALLDRLTESAVALIRAFVADLDLDSQGVESSTR